MNEEVIIGFMDESSPQTTANTQRLWSFGKPVIYKNTDKIKANAFGCCMLNGNSVIDFKEHSKKEDIGEFLITIREKIQMRRSSSFVIILTLIGQLTRDKLQAIAALI